MSLRHFWTNVVKNDDCCRYLWWPLRLRWSRGGALRLLDWHGWQVRSERCAVKRTSRGCIYGYREVFGQTFHIGPLKVCLGSHEVKAVPR